jgi:hypothetical protein
MTRTRSRPSTRRRARDLAEGARASAVAADRLEASAVAIPTMWCVRRQHASPSQGHGDVSTGLLPWPANVVLATLEGFLDELESARVNPEPLRAEYESLKAEIARLVDAIAKGVDTSPRERVGNSSGKPPALHTPRFTASATWRRCALQFVYSDHEFAMPTTGRPSNTRSLKPSVFNTSGARIRQCPSGRTSCDCEVAVLS